jgi:thiamine transport system substrate-binding protein
MNRSHSFTGLLGGLVVAALSVAACSDSSGTSGTTVEAPVTTVTLVTYSSFPTQGTALNVALAEFTADTGIGVRIVTAGDAGTMVAKAVLTAGNPEGDVMWGIDNTLSPRQPTARSSTASPPRWISATCA